LKIITLPQKHSQKQNTKNNNKNNINIHFILISSLKLFSLILLCLS
jgi:hypothetical protein